MSEFVVGDACAVETAETAVARVNDAVAVAVVGADDLSFVAVDEEKGADCGAECMRPGENYLTRKTIWHVENTGLEIVNGV